MPARRRSHAARSAPQGPALVPALVHEAGNLLAALRLSGHFLSGPVVEDERVQLARDVELLATQAGALLSQIQPLLSGRGAARSIVRVPALLEALRGSLEGCADESRLRIAKGTRLPAVRIDMHAVQQLLVLVTAGALIASAPDGVVRVQATQQGRRVRLSILDAAPSIEHKAPRTAPSGGRELAAAIGRSVLSLGGGRFDVQPRRGGNRTELFLPVGRIS